MKKQKLLLVLASLATVMAVGAFSLTGCLGNGSASESASGSGSALGSDSGSASDGGNDGVKEAELLNTYIGTFAGVLALPDYGMEQAAKDNYVINTYADGTYAMTLVKYMDMYGTDGSVTIQTTGSYNKTENEDGDTVIALSDAQSIVYTTCGMFVMQYSWNSDLPDTEFPVEFLGSTGAHNTLEDLKNGFGKGFAFLAAENTKDGQGDCLISEFVENVTFSGEAKKHEDGKKATNVYISAYKSQLNLPDYGMIQAAKDNFVVTTYEDGTYDMILVKYMDMYGTDGSVTIQTSGTFTSSENEDGDTVIVLSDAQSIVYTTCGMFVMQYSWNSGLTDTEFPVEFLGSTGAHNTLDDLKSGFGQGLEFLAIENTKAGQNDCLMQLLKVPEYPEEKPEEKPEENPETGAEE